MRDRQRNISQNSAEEVQIYLIDRSVLFMILRVDYVQPYPTQLVRYKTSVGEKVMKLLKQYFCGG